MLLQRVRLELTVDETKGHLVIAPLPHPPERAPGAEPSFRGGGVPDVVVSLDLLKKRAPISTHSPQRRSAKEAFD